MSRTYQELVILLSRGISQRNMYFEDHPRVRACARDFADGLARQQALDSQGKFFIGVANGKLIHDGKYLIGPTIIGSRLNTLSTLLCCGGFLFHKGITAGEVRLFFTFAAGQKTKLETLTESRQQLKSKNISAVELSPPYEDAGWFGRFLFDTRDSMAPDDIQDEKFDLLLPTFQHLFATVEAAHDAGHSGRALDISHVRKSSEELLKATESHVTDIMQLVKYPDYDTYTVGHSVRVAMFAVMVGKRLNLTQPILNELSVAALLHDVGKSRIPTEILFKPGLLNERERAAMEEHAVLGAEMLMENGDASEMAIAVAWGHHRRYDRKGYPAMTLGSAESSLTQIINVCDVFEALTAVRPYKKAHTARRAFEIMFNDPGWFCPAVLSAFCSSVGMYPAGSRVRLSSGHQALVIAPAEVFDRPLVRLTHDANDVGLTEGAQLEVDLSTHSSQVGVQELLLTD